eukprot:30172-Pelagococcus_subviridis.AAC.1
MGEKLLYRTHLALDLRARRQTASVEVEALGRGVARRARAVDDRDAGVRAALRDQDAVVRGRGRARRG